MCGIAGVLTNRAVEADWFRTIGEKMGSSLQHRGPDDSGLEIFQENGLLLVHRRLAIVDVSAAGHQPMKSESGRYTIVFNGEIYNHKSIRAEIERQVGGSSWRGSSDTETLLACLDTFGLEGSLAKLVGMFAFAVFDKLKNVVFLARDRVGEKPLYFGHQNGISFFASELKAIRQIDKFEPRINKDATCLFLRHNYIPSPYTIYEQVHKLPPGTYVKLGPSETPKSYWSFEDVVQSPRTRLEPSSEQEYLKELEQVLTSAVGLQMQADVPLGAFLSGGIDSSLIVALMQEQSARKTKTFSIGFDNPGFDEAPFARRVAEHLHTDHHELYVDDRMALGVVPKLATLYDEPFSDSSQIPTFLVSRLARTEVTVALSGDGGDELFGGYSRYSLVEKIWRRMGIMPQPLRQMLSDMATKITSEMWSKLLSPALCVAPARYKHTNVGEKIHKFLSVLPIENQMLIYLELISHWKNPNDMVLGAHEPDVILKRINCPLPDLNVAENLMYLDTTTYLPDDILVKVDRAAMGVSLETRVPFLDHRVLEMAWRLPASMRMRGTTGKWCLRQLLHRRVPKELLERPKTGFGVPLASWLRGELRDWAEVLLDERRLKQAAHFDVGSIRQKWDEHQSGSRNWHYHLWDILMFEAWRDEAGL